MCLHWNTDTVGGAGASVCVRVEPPVHFTDLWPVRAWVSCKAQRYCWTSARRCWRCAGWCCWSSPCLPDRPEPRRRNQSFCSLRWTQQIQTLGWKNLFSALIYRLLYRWDKAWRWPFMPDYPGLHTTNKRRQIKCFFIAVQQWWRKLLKWHIDFVAYLTSLL